MTSIDISGLSVRFADGHLGLRDVDLSVADGEFLALVGPSGSGKTTLLRAIAGFVSPSSGTIALGGVDMAAVAPEERGLGMVFQQHAVWPHMSVGQNVAYPLRFLRPRPSRGERDSRVAAALESVGLAGYARRRPDSLSGGQRQRVALARAIVAKPKVLLLDEALSALDEPLRDELRRELVALARREGLTCVHVTHDRGEALSIADRVVVMGNGSVAQVATPPQLVAKPASAAVARFIGDAEVLAGELQHGTLACPALGLSWPLDQCPNAAYTAPPPGAVDIAVAPAHVRVLPPSGQPHDAAAGAGNRVSGVVSSALYAGPGPDGEGQYSVSVRVSSQPVSGPDKPGSVAHLRATARGFKPTIDEEIELSISAPLIYPPAPAELEN